ncbi:PREDICTED: centrosomal protein of 131 kDa isoform X2 [Nanorana parkeri]|uniref:centrosomal protein of 131 kDa isoform X2 n=1 Tax=Nanorana parkeri TaxID=125878 RepID=UPI00085433A4|nr:PREDICTED: centrosomal protein of 131 kDa isoform X2 [Nanorana parkeri]
MQSSLGAPVQQGGGDNSGLALTGSQVSVTKRPSSAGSAKLISRSISVVTDTRSKGNSLKDSPGAINNLRRSNSTTQVTPGNSSLFSGDQPEDFLAFFESSSIGRKKLHGLAKTPPGRKTTWNVLDEQPRSLSVSSSARSARSVPGMKRKDLPALAPNFPANNRSNKGAVGNTVTTMVHNNYSSDDRGLSAKSSNQKTPSLNNQRSAAGEDPGSSFQKSQKNLSGTNNLGRNNTGGSSPQKRREVTTEEAERFILQVNNAAVTIQRWYRRQRQKNRAGEMAIKHMLASKKEERQQQPDENSFLKSQQTKEEERRRVREEKARQARRAAIQELQMKRAQKAIDTQRVAEEELALLVQSGKVGKKKTSCNTAMPPTGRSNKSKNNAGSRMQDTLECDSSGVPLFKPAPETRNHEQAVPVLTSTDQTPGDLEVAASAQSKTTLTDLLDTLKQLEEPEPLLDSKPDGKDKFSWIDGDAETSLTIDNLERLGQMMRRSQAEQKQIQNGTLLSEAKLQNIISFLDDMEKAEQERPRSSASNTHRGTMLSEEELTHLEQASAVATEVTSSMLKMRLELEEKRKALGLLQTALVQQRELTVRHVKQTEKELGYQLKQQSEQYESTIQRHLTFIDQLIDDKKTLSERCESLVTDLKQVDQKYASKIRQMQEQHDTVWQTLGPLCEEMKKLQELMTATEKVRREKWIDEKTRKIKEITVKGLEPEIQRLISKHKQEIRKLKALHEAELLQSDERAATRYVRQAEELRQNLEHEKEEVSQRAREQAKQRYEKQLAQEEQSLQEQRRRLYSEVAEEKERLNQQAARQRAELDELRKQLEDNCTLSTRMLKEEYEKGKEEQERRHQAEIKALKERLEIEKQAWEQNYMKKEEAWLLTRERELKAEVRKGRDKEIELVIQRLESEMSTAREECERAAENRIKRVREKYESELQELEQSERKLQDRCNQLKERATELEGEQIRLQGLLKQREQEVEDIRKITDRLNEERKSLSDVIRQEFADRLVVTEEENKRLKIEASEAQARHRLELERITREKEEELEEVHKRVKSAIVKKEETVNNLRKQCEAAVKRADHLEALLEQQRKQLLSK